MKAIEDKKAATAASKYAKEKKCGIKEIKSLRGTTQLYYAFLAGVQYERDNSKLNETYPLQEKSG